jgi:parallel beta-helix repeat protein
MLLQLVFYTVPLGGATKMRGRSARVSRRTGVILISLFIAGVFMSVNCAFSLVRNESFMERAVAVPIVPFDDAGVSVTDVRIVRGELIDNRFQPLETVDEVGLGDIFIIEVDVTNGGSETVNIYNLYYWELSPSNRVDVIGNTSFCLTPIPLQSGHSASLIPFCLSRAFHAIEAGTVSMNITVQDWYSQTVCEHTFSFEIVSAECCPCELTIYKDVYNSGEDVEITITFCGPPETPPSGELVCGWVPYTQPISFRKIEGCDNLTYWIDCNSHADLCNNVSNYTGKYVRLVNVTFEGDTLIVGYESIQTIAECFDCEPKEACDPESFTVWLHEDSTATSNITGEFDKLATGFYRATLSELEPRAKTVEVNVAGCASREEDFTVSAPGEVVDCITIDTPGVYTLVNDISGSTAECCINITASDVTFDGNGHYIQAAEVIGVERYTTGVCVGTDQRLSNVTVKNLSNVWNWDVGISFSGVDNGCIANNGVRWNKDNGILVVNSNGIEITQNDVDSNFDGIFLMDSCNNSITNNTAEANYANIGLLRSSYNTVEGNTASGGYLGISLSQESTTNAIANNTIENNLQHGLFIESDCTANTITQNVICANNRSGGSYYDIYDADASTGEENTCVTTFAYNDTGATGCSHWCNDWDKDGILDDADNCPYVVNPNQSDIDADGIGDACDPDKDGDGVLNEVDNCPDSWNADQQDSDTDGIGDICDLDRDGDDTPNVHDNCPDTANPDQYDGDGDGRGDACDLLPIFLSLRVEDALEGVTVNKVPGYQERQTFVEITTEITSQSKIGNENLSIKLNGTDKLTWVDTWMRDTSGSALTDIDPVDLGSGEYNVTINLSPSPLSGSTIVRDSKQIVWRFKIPNDLPPQYITVNAEIQKSGIEAYRKSGTIRILAEGVTDCLIITNRELLYHKYDEADVTLLLQRLFTEARGPPSSSSPLGVIYYVDRYNSDARNWNNSVVGPTSGNTANEIADKIYWLISAWYADAEKCEPPPWGCIGPDYLLIVGDDNVIPFHRCDDPCSAETWVSDISPGHTAMKWGYLFTDNRYADRWKFAFDDWTKGDIESYVGRLLGLTAADMLTLLEEGVDTNNGKRGDVVMASIAGYTLGDVPEDYVGKGFEVRNDDVPISEVCTIDVQAPYEGGDDAWTAAFRNATNDERGMDLFYIGGHGNRNFAELPGKDIDTCDIHKDYPRLGIDHPIVFFTGCHTGFLYGGTGSLNDTLAYRLIHEGVRAYLAPFGLSSFIEGDQIHGAEQFSRLVLKNLIEPDSSNSMPIGKAVAEAKTDYDFPYISQGAWQERAEGQKTVVEFNLLGVPWATFSYPARCSTAHSARLGINDYAFTTREGPVVAHAQANTYSRTFTVDIESYDVVQETVGEITYDLFSVEGGKIAFGGGAPILPYVAGITLPLPLGGNVTAVELNVANATPIGIYTIPIAKVQPASEGGLTYTTETDIDYPYPKVEDLVGYELTSEGMLFTVFPIQYNPATDETTFYDHFEVNVTYFSPSYIVVTEFATEKREYVPGEMINTSTTLANIGDADAVLNTSVEIRNAFGDLVATQMSDDFTVHAGSSYQLQLNWNGELGDGAYAVELTIRSPEGVEAGAADHIAVLGGRITELAVPPQLEPGEEDVFYVSFVNYRSTEVTGNVNLTIQLGEGGFREELAPHPFTVAGKSTKRVNVTWRALNISVGDCYAIATAAVNDQAYGPVSERFEVSASPSQQNRWDLAPGFNMISLPVNDASITTAASLAAKLGSNCTEVVTFNGTQQQLQSYVPGVPLNNFAIVGGRGYFVNLNHPTSVLITGTGWPSPFGVSLVPGLNLIGLPVNDTSVTTASTLAAKIGGNCKEVVNWERGTQSYVSYVTGVPLNDFVIRAGDGYFVTVDNQTEVTFEGSSWEN